MYRLEESKSLQYFFLAESLFAQALLLIFRTYLVSVLLLPLFFTIPKYPEDFDRIIIL